MDNVPVVYIIHEITLFCLLPPLSPPTSCPLLFPSQEGAQELCYSQACVCGVLVPAKGHSPRPPAGGAGGKTATFKTHQCCKL